MRRTLRHRSIGLLAFVVLTGATVVLTAAPAAAAPLVAVTDASLTEPNSGTVNMVFTVGASEVSDGTISVDYRTQVNSAGTADFTSISFGTATIPKGATSVPVAVAIKGDLNDEFDETFFLVLTAVRGATFADSTGVGTILDNDAAPSLRIADKSITEGDTSSVLLGFKITLNRASGKEVRVNFATSNSTATSPTDYTALTTTVIFSPGVTSRTVNVTTIGDRTLERPSQSFRGNLSSPVNATIPDPFGSGIITDNDEPVLFVHGYGPFDGGNSCSADWADIKDLLDDPLRGAYTPAQLQSVKWYYNDSGCNRDTTNDGSHSVHFGGTTNDRHRTIGSITNAHTTKTPLEHIGYHVAWMIYNDYTANGVPVDIVIHSMGGLVVRYALGQVEARHPDFPPELLVEDVITMGSPHGGSDAAGFCFDPQCEAAKKNSYFVNMIEDPANPHFRHPDPGFFTTTDWTVIGAFDDDVVDEVSAVAMSQSDHRVQYVDSADYTHDDLLHERTTSDTADVRWQNGTSTTWSSTLNGLHIIEWLDRSMYSTSW